MVRVMVKINSSSFVHLQVCRFSFFPTSFSPPIFGTVLRFSRPTLVLSLTFSVLRPTKYKGINLELKKDNFLKMPPVRCKMFRYIVIFIYTIQYTFTYTYEYLYIYIYIYICIFNFHHFKVT